MHGYLKSARDFQFTNTGSDYIAFVVHFRDSKPWLAHASRLRRMYPWQHLIVESFVVTTQLQISISDMAKT
jgi:hypothetical protein